MLAQHAQTLRTRNKRTRVPFVVCVERVEDACRADLLVRGAPQARDSRWPGAWLNSRLRRMRFLAYGLGCLIAVLPAACANPSQKAPTFAHSSQPRWPGWSEFKEATLAFRPRIRPGRTVRMQPHVPDIFAHYLTQVHQRLHPEFAIELWSQLPNEGELGNLSLVTKVEMGIAPDGSLRSIGIVRTSGSAAFDFGVYQAVTMAAPYFVPPVEVRSADGATYIRWSFHRDASQCGTWNAEPYIVAPVEQWPTVNGGARVSKTP